jgi:hypothetical protein
MLKTEKQAQEGWCPMVRSLARVHDAPMAPVAAANTYPYYSDDRRAESVNCIGSRCMMWRWGDNFNLRQKFHQATGEDATATTEPPRPAGVPADWTWEEYEGDGYSGWLEPEADMLARRVGYCGLAGHPLDVARIISEAGR